MSQPKRIFVIGHMGAGKFLLSEALAKKLGWEHIDANPSLERYIGKSLHDILGKEGEAAFHRCEAEIISQQLKQANRVIVLEEAVIATEQNRKLLAPEFVVYLKVSTPTQIERMKDGRVPLLPIPDLKVFLGQLHQERDHLFEEVATITVESTSVEEDVKKILNAIEKH